MGGLVRDGRVVAYGWKRHYWYALAETDAAVDARTLAREDFYNLMPTGLNL